MPVYEQILPQDKPQTTTKIIIDETKRNTLPGLDACTPTCVNHYANNLSKSENRCIDQPMHVQNGLQPIDSTETFEHSDPIGQNVYDTFFTETSTTTPSVHSNFHPTLTLDTNDDSINNSTGKEGTQAVLVSASVTQIKQEAETLGIDNSD